MRAKIGTLPSCMLVFGSKQALLKGRTAAFSMLVLAPVCLNLASAQNAPGAAPASILQQRYTAAQTFQAQGNLERAAQQYRIFLADALGQLAIGYARAGHFTQAADQFDEALRLVPSFPSLRLEYAHAALQAGSPERARVLADELARTPALDPKLAAGAHEILGRVLLKQDRDEDAKVELERAVALDPTFENGYELAIAELDLGHADAAKKIFAEMLASYGNQPELHLYFGQAFSTSDLQAEAIDEFRKAAALNSKLPGLHYSLAAAYLASSGTAKQADAEAELRKEIAVSPQSGSAYAALGHLLSNNGSDPKTTAEAEADLKQAIKLDPTNPDAYLYLGQLYAASDRSAEAQAALKRSIELTTDVTRNTYQVQKAHYLLGHLLLAAGEQDQGKAELAASAALVHRNLHQDQTRLAQYLGASDTAQSSANAVSQPDTLRAPTQDAEGLKRVELLQQQFAPALADSYNNLGAIAAGKEDFRSAVNSFRHAAEWNPQMPGLDYNWGRAAFAAGMSAEAIGPLERYFQQHPEDDGARAVLGLCLYQQKRFGEAVKLLAPFESKPDTAPQIHFAYADSLVKSGSVAQGTAQLETLVKADPRVADLHRALAHAYALQHAPAAVHEYEAALSLNPDDLSSLTELARLQLDQGDPSGAAVHLKRALELKPKDAVLQQELAEANRRAVHP